MGQSAPGYFPAEPYGDYELLVMARIHSIYEAKNLRDLARMMGSSDG